MESTYLSWSQSGFYQESIKSLPGVHTLYQGSIRMRGGVSLTDDYMYRPYELSEKSLYEWIQIYTRLKRTKAEQKKIQSKKHEDVKPLAVFHSDEKVDTDFESDSDYVEFDQAPEKEKAQGKYAFLQNHPLYETHQVSISKSKILVPNFAGGSLPRCDRGDR